MLHQAGDIDLRVVDQRQTGVGHLGQVVRRNIGGHAHRDAGRAVDQQVGQACRQDLGLTLRLIVVGDEIDRFLVDVGQQLMGDLGHAHFGVTHGRGGVAVDGTEVALAVDQHVAQGEGLGHAHDGVVDRGIAVRVVFTDDVTDHAGRLLVGLVPVVAQLAHGVEHAAVHRLEAVPHIRQGPADDYAHGVIQIGLLHLLLDIDREDLFGKLGHWRAFSLSL